MEHWHTSTAGPYQREPTDLSLGSRVLTSSSGNIQAYNPDSKDGIENQDPLNLPRTESWIKPEVQYPIPKVKLGSNDSHAENIAHLHHRRQNHRDKFFRKRRVDSDRPYLQHPKYIQYRARQRCDTGPDGKLVWDDQIEDAFQNALVNIPPMGRRKKSQRGRPHGRNELISEWIYQETGAIRSRKQVSSHIQVLNTLLKDIPEWAALVTATDDRGGGGSEFYSNSIKDMVRNQASMSNRMFYRASNRPLPPGTYPSSNGAYGDRHSCSRLSFKMWVSLPDQISQALHQYTRLQSNSSISAPIPLEDVKNWRVSFPNLRSITESWSMEESCDILLLDASFQLMTDFPPKFSKLGISLELDFMHPSGHNKEALQTLVQWKCVTHIFQYGRLVKESQDIHPGNELPPGKVRPLFESKWWASTFTNLTEKRKRAEDSESDGAVELANEASRNFFKGLTVMQEIWAEQQGSGKRRMGILLWRFSQATAPYVGTTTWQKLIPPGEMALRSDPAMGEMGLPALGMDTMMSGSQDSEQMFGNPQGFMPVADTQPYDMFDTNMEELCQDGFMYTQDQLTDFTNLQDEAASFAFDPTAGPMPGDMGMSYGLPPQEPQQMPEHVQGPQGANLFEHPQLKRQDSERRLELNHVPPHDSYPGEREKINGQPLAKFDHNTHKVLQAQLAGEQQYYQQSAHHTHPSPHAPQMHAPQPVHPHQPPPPTPMSDHDETMRALLAASAMSDLGNTPSRQTPQHIPTPTPTSAASSRAPGPPQPQPSYSHARPHPPQQPQPLYIPSTQAPFSHPSTHPAPHSHQHLLHQQGHAISPHPQSAPLPLSASTTHSMPLSYPSHHPQHHPQLQQPHHPLQHPVPHRPILHSHHSFTAARATDAPYHQPTPPHPSDHHQHPHHPHSHRRVPSKNGFAAALANLDAYAAENGDGDYALPTGAFDGGAGAVALAAEIARPQSQPVQGSSEIGGYDEGPGPAAPSRGDEWAGPRHQEPSNVEPRKDEGQQQQQQQQPRPPHPRQMSQQQYYQQQPQGAPQMATGNGSARGHPGGYVEVGNLEHQRQHAGLVAAGSR